jgi:hypothetical protein
MPSFTNGSAHTRSCCYCCRLFCYHHPSSPLQPCRRCSTQRYRCYFSRHYPAWEWLLKKTHLLLLLLTKHLQLLLLLLLLLLLFLL